MRQKEIKKKKKTTKTWKLAIRIFRILWLLVIKFEETKPNSTYRFRVECFLEKSRRRDYECCTRAMRSFKNETASKPVRNGRSRSSKPVNRTPLQTQTAAVTPVDKKVSWATFFFFFFFFYGLSLQEYHLMGNVDRACLYRYAYVLEGRVWSSGPAGRVAPQKKKKKSTRKQNTTEIPRKPTSSVLFTFEVDHGVTCSFEKIRFIFNTVIILDENRMKYCF